MLVAMQPLEQENPPYTSTVLESVGGGSVSVLRMRDLAEAQEMGLGGSLLFKAAALAAVYGHPRIALDYFYLKALLLYPPHAIVIRLHGHGSYVVVLIPETADLLGL